MRGGAEHLQALPPAESSPGMDPAADGLLLRRFESLAALTPDAPALTFLSQTQSYRQLNEQANVIAHALLRAGVVRGDRVGVLLEPSVEMLAALIGVLKAGAAYVPLDPAYPRERLQAVVLQATPPCIISSQRFADTLQFAGARQLLVDDVLCEPALADAATVNPAVALHGDDLCYVMYTSGTTGAPNGVMVTHGNIAGLFANVQGSCGFGTADSWSAMHSFAFGFSVWELWGPLSTGGRLVMVPYSQRRDPVAWVELLLAEKVSVLSITPSAFRQWLLGDNLPDAAALEYLRLIVFSGEAVREDDLRHWFARYGNAGPQLLNTYALTETAGRVAVLAYTPGQTGDAGNIGWPTPDAQLILVDPASGRPSPAGAEGELLIAGPMVARGYLGNAALTAQRFIDYDTGNGVMQRCYRSGDRARRNADGSYCFVGRTDEQLKLRGHRIEPRDIEQVLRAHPGVADVAVLLDESGAAPRLVAWLVAAGASGDAISDARPADPANAVELWPSLGEYQVYDPLLYDFMSADEVRVASYRRAFERHVKDKVVLDIGTGKDAILARLCAAAGARRVYAVEVLDEAFDAAHALIEQLGLADRIVVLRGDMQAIVLPEAVDVCTQGIVGNIGSSDGIIAIWNAARRLFAPGAVAIPSHCETLIAPAQLPAAVRETPAFGPLAADYANRIFAAAGGPFDVRLCVRNFPLSGLLAEAAVFEDLDFSAALPLNMSGQAEFVIAKAGLFDGFLLWTRIRTDADESVDFLQHQQAWLPVWFPMADTAVAVQAGDRLRVQWQITTPAGQVFPDYAIEAFVAGAAADAARRYSYRSPHFSTARGETELHRRLLAAVDGDAAPAAELGFPAEDSARIAVPILAQADGATGAVGQDSADARSANSIPALGDAMLRDIVAWARERLPAHMLPSRWEWLAALPLNSNGKLDRRALAAQAAALQGDASSAATGYSDPFEAAIAALWSRVLGRDAMGRDEDFFDSGGDSILAVRLTTEVQRYLDDAVFLAALFDAPTVAGYAAWLREHHAAAVERRVAAFDDLPGMEKAGRASSDRSGGLSVDDSRARPANDLLNNPPPTSAGAPLSAPQQSLWILQQLYPDSTAANEQFVVRVTGGADPERLRRAWHAVLGAHDILRAYFTGGAAKPRQVIAQAALCIERDTTPLCDLGAESGQVAAARLRADAAVDIGTAFDLAHPPLLRSRLYQMPDGELALLVTAHHIIADGLCVELIRDALARAYDTGALVRPALQYADFCARQLQALAAGRYAGELAWWQAQLAGHDSQLLSGDPGHASVQGRQVREAFVIDAALADRLRHVARAEGATVFMLFLAAWRAWLQRCFDVDDLLIGSPATLRRDEATAGMLGCMVNNLVFRNPGVGARSFRDLLRAERSSALAAYDRSNAPFEQIVEALQPARIFGRHPLFQVMFMFEDRSAPPAMAGDIVFSSDVLPVDRASYWDLELSVTDRGAGNDLPAFLGIRADLFDVTALATWPEGFVAMLEAVAADPDAKVAHLPLLSHAQRQRMLHDWNDTRMPLPSDTTLHGLFSAQAARSPARPAVQDWTETLSYAALQARAARYAAVLAEQGIGRGSRVALGVERSADTVALLLAVLQRGACWLPLDPAYPAARLALMIEDAQPDLLVCDATVAFAPVCPVLQRTDLQQRASTVSDTHPAAAVSGADAAFILFTSGSTGRPKGALSAHAGAVSRCAWMWQAFGFTAADVFAQRTSLNFIDAVWEIFGPLLHGARLVVLPPHIERDAPAIAQWLQSEQVTHLVTVPVLLDALLTAGESASPPRALRSVISSGEALRPSLAARFAKVWSHAALINTYGTSETWDASYYRVPETHDEFSAVPIGRPVANAALYILDGNGEPLPPGATGELFVGGLALAREYVNNPALTQLRFLPDPFVDDAAARLYRTGDLARYRADGNVLLAGRADRQIKLRGLRIEAGDVESCARAYTGVRQCVLRLQQPAEGEPWLALYVAAAPELDTTGLRRHLQAALPRAFVPADICVLDSLPLTPSGKVDVRALPVLNEPAIAADIYVAPRDAMEQRLAEIWQAALGAPRVGVHDDFFALRGHSLLAVQVIARICDEYAIELPLQALFETPTVAGLARSVSAMRWARPDSLPAADAGEGEGEREVLRL